MPVRLDFRAELGESNRKFVEPDRLECVQDLVPKVDLCALVEAGRRDFPSRQDYLLRHPIRGKRQVVVDQHPNQSHDREALADLATDALVGLPPLDILEGRPTRETSFRTPRLSALALRPVQISVQDHSGAFAREEHAPLPRLRVERRSRSGRLGNEEPRPGAVAAQRDRQRAVHSVRAGLIECTRNAQFPSPAQRLRRERAAGLV